MKRLITSFSLVVALFATSATASVQDAIERTYKVINAYQKGDEVWANSGTAWKLYGRYVVTNKHVALGCGSSVCIRRLYDHLGGVHEFRVVGVSYKVDVAVLESLTDLPGRSPKFNLDRPLKGDSVYSIGYPGGKFKVSDKCIIKEIGLLSIFNDYHQILTNCYVVGGASGSALYDAHGEIVGLVYAMGYHEETIVDGNLDNAKLDHNKQYSIPADIFTPEIKFILENPSVIEGTGSTYKGIGA